MCILIKYNFIQKLNVIKQWKTNTVGVRVNIASAPSRSNSRGHNGGVCVCGTNVQYIKT